MLTKLNNVFLGYPNKHIYDELARRYNYHCVLLIPSPLDGGETIGSGYYKDGTMALFEAYPNEEYQFLAWSDGNTYSSRYLSIVEDITLSAMFNKIITDDGEIQFIPNYKYFEKQSQSFKNKGN